MVMVLSIKMNG